MMIGTPVPYEECEGAYIELIKSKMEVAITMKKLQNGEKLFHGSGSEITETFLREYLEYIGEIENEEAMSRFIAVTERESQLKRLLP